MTALSTLGRPIKDDLTSLDFLIQPKRNARAALELMRKLLKKQGCAPTWNICAPGHFNVTMSFPHIQ